MEREKKKRAMIAGMVSMTYWCRVWYIIGMPVVIADVFDGISFITGFGCEKFVNQEV